MQAIQQSGQPHILQNQVVVFKEELPAPGADQHQARDRTSRHRSGRIIIVQ